MTIQESAVSDEDLQRLTAQLGRPPRGLIAVVARCSDDWPAVVTTAPRLPDGTPFPTFYYLTCRRLNSALSTLESEGFMRDYATALADDPELAAAYRGAHQAYLKDREQIEHVVEIADYSAGGMPDRVKCLHALVGHSLAAGPGINPIGDLAIAEVTRRGVWPHGEVCVPTEVSS